MTNQLNPEAQRYLATLRRVPDDIILATATREFDMEWGDRCLCGWVVAEAMADLTDQPAEFVTYEDLVKRFTDGFRPSAARALFGGSLREWITIYEGVVTPHMLPDIEIAFTERVNEAVAA